MLRKISISTVITFYVIVSTSIVENVVSDVNNCSIEYPSNSNRSIIDDDNLDGVNRENVSLTCECSKLACLPICCPIGKRLNSDECVTLKNSTTFKFPAIHDSLTHELISDEINLDDFRIIVRDPCQGGEKYRLQPDVELDDEFKLLDNGTIFMTTLDSYVDIEDYCFGAIDGDRYHVVLCFDDDYEEQQNDEVITFYPVGMILSVPFLLLTFVVYTVLPELRNMHGVTLRCYVGPLVVAYTLLAYIQISRQDYISDSVCILMAFIIHFSFLSSFFWLNVMCFDIWWTFGGFRSMQGSVKQRERKKFIFYSIYAWGSATLLTGVCLIMDFVPSVPKNFIKPGFGVQSCWFATNGARALYFYGPIGVTVICNIFLFISTTIKIIQHKKDTAHHLKGIDSRRHDDNKQWFNLYLKLFIVMGINWSMEIISWLFNGTPHYFWYITDLANTLQGLIIFIIFVWKDKTKKLLLKRLGFKDPNFQSHNSTRSAYLSSGSKTCTTNLTPVTAPLQEKINPFVERTKTTTDESDGV